MYPFITIAGAHLELTGIGIILAFFTFVIVCRLHSQRMSLSFHALYNMLPALVACVYGGGSYIGFLTQTGHIMPYSFAEFYSLLLPSDYQFHAGGMVVGMVLFLVIFINNQPGRFIKYKRIDCIFMSLMYAIIVLGIFLLLGDDMIGLSTENWMGVYAFTPLSEVAKFNKVYPVGLFLSLAALGSLLLSTILQHLLREVGRGYGGFGIFLLLLGGVLLFQHYPRHGVIIINTIRYDINQYITRIVALYCLGRYRYMYLHNKNKNNKRIITLSPLP